MSGERESGGVSAVPTSAEFDANEDNKLRLPKVAVDADMFE